MAQTWYLANGISSNVHQELTLTETGTDGSTSPAYGWIAGTTAAGNFSDSDANTKRIASTFGATEPTALVSTAAIGNAWRSPTPLNGSYAAGNWTVDATMIGTVIAGLDIRAKCRLFRSSNSNGSSATEITSAAQTGGTITNITNASQSNSQIVFDPGAITLTNEYFFLMIYLEVVGASSGKFASSADAIFRVGTTASKIITTDFTQTATQTACFQADGSSIYTNVAGAGKDWAGPSNAGKADGAVASCTNTLLGIDELSDYLKITAFGPYDAGTTFNHFVIPTGSTINSIQVDFDRNVDTGTAWQDYSILPVVADASTGTDKSAAATWSTTMTVATFTWTAAEFGSPTVAQVNASDFGIQIQVTNNDGGGQVARIDQVRMTVFYTAPSGSPKQLSLVPGRIRFGSEGRLLQVRT